MTWVVELVDEFEAEFLLLAPAVQDGLLAMTRILKDQGPLLARPYVDTLKGSRFVNMKELRF